MTKTSQFPKYQFSEIKRLNPFWSDHTCFIETIQGKKYLHPRIIKKWFDKLVAKDEYAREDRNEILRYLFSLTSSNAQKG